MVGHDRVPMKTHDEMPLEEWGLSVDTANGLEEMMHPTLCLESKE